MLSFTIVVLLVYYDQTILTIDISIDEQTVSMLENRNGKYGPSPMLGIGY